ncbi:MAG TPA: PQQ-binding-like beta-propeller repeat protein [Candidatus Paceibacterota bacterium]|nr:PQQ-binding-like beta-propeller repeat protein [Candidatus Paceibacterota bacterium]
MQTSDLLFIGIKGSVIALDRATGRQVWATHLKGWGFVNLLVHDDTVYALCNGEIFCLDPLTGNGLWHNPLRGFGTGLATMALAGAVPGSSAPAVAEQRHRAARAAAAAA